MNATKNKMNRRTFVLATSAVVAATGCGSDDKVSTGSGSSASGAGQGGAGQGGAGQGGAGQGGAGQGGAAAVNCDVETGSQTEGPFYPGEPPVRVDITEDRPGLALALDVLVVSKGPDCPPVANAEVDVWSADAVGDYSGYSNFDTVGEGWLRGQQTTNENGVAAFQTIVPGSYMGRAVHIHVKVRAAGFDELTTQVYFPDDLAAAALTLPAYSGGAAQTSNGTDGFYDDDTLMAVTGDTANGYVARATMVI